MTEKKKDVAVEKRPQGGGVELAQDQPVFVPATDIYEREDAVLVACDMPGVEQSQVDVTLENDILTLTGVQATGDPQGKECLHRGYRTGVWRRSFTLTADVDHGKIQARIANGVLKVLLPKAEQARPRRIAVEAGA
jgi:HSP20 family protein